ncbi:MAG: phosphohydrolase [Betaproteobacteria bacterium]|nr:phosphohydrolase [Betaproteobacteria bacterium]
MSLYAELGHLQYAGEGVSQLQHAWQCGELARQANASEALQLASWLHDIGHLMTRADGTPTLRGEDDRHQDLAATVLLPIFSAAVAGPVALHVEAKRYLVAAHTGYRGRLSPDSVRSLELQGGAMSEEQCAVFRSLPHAEEAMRLRAWDDAAKVAALQPQSAHQAICQLRELMASVLSRGHTKIAA